MTLPMIPGSWYQPRKPIPGMGLTLAQAANGMRTLPVLPQPNAPGPTPEVPYVPQTLAEPPQPAYLAVPPQPKPYGGLDYAEFGYYDDSTLQDVYHLEQDPARRQRMMLEMTRRRAAAPGDWSELVPIDQRPEDPGYAQAQQFNTEMEQRPQGAYSEPRPAGPDLENLDVTRPPPETQKDQGDVPGFEDLIAGLLNQGSAGAGEAAGGVHFNVPGLPQRPTFDSEAPDFGPFPEAPVLSAPDYSEANRYYEAGKPKKYSADPEEMGLAVLAGALGGFSPYGSVGEILGRMAGPGISGGFAQHKEDRALGRQYDRDLAAWNAARGGAASDQAGTLAEVANTNLQNQYQNAVAKYQDAEQRFNTAREEDRWQASYDLQRAQAELQRAQMQINAGLVQAQIGYYNRRGYPTSGAGGLSMGSIMKTISDGVNMGALPGIEGMNEQLEATKQALLANAQKDPNRLALYMTDPKSLDLDAKRMLTEQIWQLAQTNPELMQSLLMSSMKGKTGMSMEDVILGLSGE